MQEIGLEEKIFSALERIHTSSRSALNRTGHEHSLSPLQAQILHFAHRRNTASVSQLAEQLRVTKPTISDAIAALLTKKLIKKTASKEDARGYSITLTAKGSNEAVLIASYATPFLDSVNTLSTPQKQALWDALINLLRTMESQRLIPHQRMCFSCKYFEQNKKAEGYYCRLMEAPLCIDELRIDCNEHECIAS